MATKTCSKAAVVHRQAIYLDLSVRLDILTHILIISAALLWPIKINLRQKFAIGGYLGLSIFMIIIATIRVALAPLSQGVTDSVWLFFWQFVEAATAIIMICLTAVRSAIGQERNNSSREIPRAKLYINMTSSDRYGNSGFKLTGVSAQETGDVVGLRQKSV